MSDRVDALDARIEAGKRLPSLGRLAGVRRLPRQDASCVALSRRRVDEMGRPTA